jgi:tetratricopeptide (TPR) repeat protein
MRRYLAEIAREHLYAPEEALYHYEHALDAVESPGIELRMGMVDVLVDLQRWEDALEKVESLLSDRDAALTDEHRVAILSQGAKAAAEAGLSEKSQTLYKKILVLRPDHPEARNAIAGAD